MCGRETRILANIEESSSSLQLSQMALGLGDGAISLPDWAEWLIWLGQWMLAQTSYEGRRIAIVRLPCRRTAAAFASLGVLCQSAQAHDDKLDWEALKGLSAGTKVYWRDSRLTGHSGHVVGVSFIAGQELVVVTVDGGRRGQPVTQSFAQATALRYGITLGVVTNRVNEQLGGVDRLMKNVIHDFNPSWLHSPRVECSIVSEKSSFLGDLDQLRVGSGGVTSELLSDILSISESVGRTHGRTKLVSTHQPGIFDGPVQVTILDGIAATLRLAESTANCVIALVDRTEYDEDVTQIVATFMGSASDKYLHIPANGLRVPPPSIDIVVFGLASTSGTF